MTERFYEIRYPTVRRWQALPYAAQITQRPQDLNQPMSLTESGQGNAAVIKISVGTGTNFV
jgi:hypothetical protein